MSTPDASGAAKYYRSHYNQWCSLHWMLCVAKKISDRKLLPRSIYDLLTQISNDFQWSLYRVQCRQTLAFAVRVPGCPPGAAFPYGVWSRHCVTHLSRRNKATSVFDRRPSAPWVHPALDSWSTDVLRFFFCHSSRLFTKRFLLHIMSRHAPYYWLATSLFWYSAPTQFSKMFLKNDTPHL